MLKLAATSGKLFTGIGKSFFATSYSKFGTTKAPSAGKERQRQVALNSNIIIILVGMI
jgi:hypothetical protein